MPQPDLPSVKALVVLPGRIPQHLIFRGVGLYQRPAGLVTPARSAHNLGQKYKGAFGGAGVMLSLAALGLGAFIVKKKKS